jgi:hypothetical protein
VSRFVVSVLVRFVREDFLYELKAGPAGGRLRRAGLAPAATRPSPEAGLTVHSACAATALRDPRSTTLPGERDGPAPVRAGEETLLRGDPLPFASLTADDGRAHTGSVSRVARALPCSVTPVDWPQRARSRMRS